MTQYQGYTLWTKLHVAADLWHKNYSVLWLHIVDQVPGMAIMYGNYLNHAIMHSYHGNAVKLSKLIISFDCGQQL